ncbi:serine hydrolase [Clostridium estertheticum]|uniref:serine hydrolase domain-containing protein n=1 Tax=Clostridium estertheticum TaxID=238834 RepID=UPI001C6F5118|nr:serine hydrolase domain-containing protein [Clostridium estertheticum]MBW9151993.1 beta-lactamase family protein [Clostridium estertheticum]WLC85028.1 beta-lactamase family protein [Clostridium estertheticum]
MKIKRRIFTLSLIMLICTSSMTALATNNTPLEKLTTKSVYGLLPENLRTKTSGGVEFKKGNINKAKSFSTNDYVDTKAVAEKKAFHMTTDYDSLSVQYALIDNGKIVLSGNSGVYSKENTKALTSHSMYCIGSVSKMFVTTAVMKLVDSGKIKLDTPITEYIKEFKMVDDRYKKITVRMLLNHSSGLMGSSFSNTLLLGDNDTYSHDTFLDQLKLQRLKAEPGAYSVYCNDGFTLAQILVEHVTGIDYTTYITNTFASPLKMEDTKTPVSEFDRDRLAKTYYSGISSSLPAENLNAIGAGGVYSSAEDLCTFATTFTKNSNGILSQNAIKAMENKEYLNGIWTDDTDNTLGYGLGWDSVNLYPFNLYNIKALSKGGDSIFYHSNLTVLPEQNMAVAVVTSGGSSSYNQILAQEILLAALKEKGVISKIKQDKVFAAPEKTTVPTEVVKKYEGLYISPSGFIDIKIDKTGTLSLSSPQAPENGTQTLIYTKDGTFVSSEGSASLKFVEETNGKIYIKQTGYQSLKLLGQTTSNLYLAQKENVNKLTDSVSEAWAKREGKKYFLLDEKYSSIFMLSCPNVQVSFTKGLEGYFRSDKIVDNNSAVAILDGPGILSRDLVDYTFYKKDKFEYLNAGGFTYVEEDAIETFPTKNKFTCAINKEGYARWYKIGDQSTDKEITVKIPKKAAFAVYDSKGDLVNDSLITGTEKVTLPKDGRIVFLGDALAEFNIEYKE